MSGEQHSAEKDLLRLIENPGEIKAPDAPSSVAAKKKGGLFAKKGPAAAKSATAGKKLDLQAILSDRKQVLRALFVATICVFAYLVFTVAREYTKLRNSKDVVKFTYVSQGKEAAANTPAETAPTDAISVIRNIFKPGPAKKEVTADEAAPGIGDYKLVGISQDPNPADAYVMVQNTKTGITFFLKEGETLDGMKVEKIHDDRAVMNAKGRSVELK